MSDTPEREVLVVDDSADCLATLELSLGLLKAVNIRSVSNAEDALSVLECGRVAAVITDVQLPGMSGLELLARIRSRAEWRNLPVIVISADASTETPESARRLGACAYFAKPFSPGAVRKKLEDLMYAKSAP
jgi:two-component system chemotaxis response regulator CheY